MSAVELDCLTGNVFFVDGIGVFKINEPTAIVFRQLSKMVRWTFALESRPDTWCSKAALAVSKEQVEKLQS
jgi:hypothetical protein